MKLVLKFVASNIEYQIILEIEWWRRIELRYGENLNDIEDFDDLLKWAISSQLSESLSNEDKNMVQRLNVSGSEEFNKLFEGLKI